MKVGDRICELRTRAGLKRPELEQLAGFGRGHVWLLEHREQCPSAKTLKSLAGVFGTQIDYLMSGEGAPPSDRALARAVSKAREIAGVSASKALR